MEFGLAVAAELAERELTGDFTERGAVLVRQRSSQGLNFAWAEEVVVEQDIDLTRVILELQVLPLVVEEPARMQTAHTLILEQVVLAVAVAAVMKAPMAGADVAEVEF